jgi:hypothetical protein
VPLAASSEVSVSRGLRVFIVLVAWAVLAPGWPLCCGCLWRSSVRCRPLSLCVGCRRLLFLSCRVPFLWLGLVRIPARVGALRPWLVCAVRGRLLFGRFGVRLLSLRVRSAAVCVSWRGAFRR